MPATLLRLLRRAAPVEETIALVGLEEKADSRGEQLSGGQRRRLDVALALIGDPELIFLDEPTTGFDPSARRTAWAVIEGLRTLGKTVFLTTHYMDEAERLADRIAVIARGRIVAEGTPDTLGGRDSLDAAIRFTLPAGVAHGSLPDELAAIATAEPDGRVTLKSPRRSIMYTRSRSGRAPRGTTSPTSSCAARRSRTSTCRSPRSTTATATKTRRRRDLAHPPSACPAQRTRRLGNRVRPGARRAPAGHARAHPPPGPVGSSRSAVPALPPVRFSDPPSEPDLPIPEHPALHGACVGRS